MHHDDCWRRRVSNAELASYPRQSCKSLRVHNGTAEIFARFTNVLVGFLIGILFITCHNARPQLNENGAERPILSATPNPVPAGDLDKPVGTTTITWDTGNGALGAISMFKSIGSRKSLSPVRLRAEMKLAGFSSTLFTSSGWYHKSVPSSSRR